MMRRPTRPALARSLPLRVLGFSTLVSTSLGSVLAILATSLCLTAILGGCDKPKQADCEKAVANIRNIYGTRGLDYGTDPSSMVRSCRGSASRASVQCFIAAKTMEDVKQCEGGSFDEIFGDEGKDTPATTPAPATNTAPATAVPSTPTSVGKPPPAAPPIPVEKQPVQPAPAPAPAPPGTN